MNRSGPSRCRGGERPCAPDSPPRHGGVDERSDGNVALQHGFRGPRAGRDGAGRSTGAAGQGRTGTRRTPRRETTAHGHAAARSPGQYLCADAEALRPDGGQQADAQLLRGPVPPGEPGDRGHRLRGGGRAGPRPHRDPGASAPAAAQTVCVAQAGDQRDRGRRSARAEAARRRHHARVAPGVPQRRVGGDGGGLSPA